MCLNGVRPRLKIWPCELFDFLIDCFVVVVVVVVVVVNFVLPYQLLLRGTRKFNSFYRASGKQSLLAALATLALLAPLG